MKTITRTFAIFTLLVSMSSYAQSTPVTISQDAIIAQTDNSSDFGKVGDIDPPKPAPKP
jgi:hypothetical protein